MWMGAAGSKGLDDRDEDVEMERIQGDLRHIFEARSKLRKEMLSFNQLERDRLRERNRIQKDIQRIKFLEVIETPFDGPVPHLNAIPVCCSHKEMDCGHQPHLKHLSFVLNVKIQSWRKAWLR